MTAMTKRMLVSLNKDEYAKLLLIKERDGAPIAEQVRRALALWFAKKLGPNQESR